MPRSVAVLTLGCGRNEADSEELAGRLAAAGWDLVGEPADADAVLVNTCGFIDAAKKDSVDMLLAAADTGRPVLAAGCLAQRYGAELAAALPEAAAVLSFDDYPDIAGVVERVLAGERRPAHRPGDRRRALPVTPVDRPAPEPRFRPPVRRRLDGGPVAPLKIASGCDRRCAFCAIPMFRGSFVSRPPEQVLAEAEWLAGQGVRELALVSENTTSYGKDLGDLRALERLLPQLAAVPGIVRIRLSYLQPAEMRETLVAAMATTPGVAPYFDLSFQHASAPLLRRMRRFGDGHRFGELLRVVRAASPRAGVRSNVIVGFPGETRADMAALTGFLQAAQLDAVGVFAYSDEEGTEAARLRPKVRSDAVARRYARVVALVEELTAQRAAERVGERVDVLVEQLHPDGVEGRAAHQGPADGSTVVRTVAAVGDLVPARVVAAEGVDLVAEPVGPPG